MARVLTLVTMERVFTVFSVARVNSVVHIAFSRATLLTLRENILGGEKCVYCTLLHLFIL